MMERVVPESRISTVLAIGIERTLIEKRFGVASHSFVRGRWQTVQQRTIGSVSRGFDDQWRGSCYRHFRGISFQFHVLSNEVGLLSHRVWGELERVVDENELDRNEDGDYEQAAARPRIA